MTFFPFSPIILAMEKPLRREGLVGWASGDCRAVKCSSPARQGLAAARAGQTAVRRGRRRRG